jgi:hypothetical protein
VTIWGATYETTPSPGWWTGFAGIFPHQLIPYNPPTFAAVGVPGSTAASHKVTPGLVRHRRVPILGQTKPPARVNSLAAPAGPAGDLGPGIYLCNIAFPINNGLSGGGGLMYEIEYYNTTDIPSFASYTAIHTSGAGPNDYESSLGGQSYTCLYVPTSQVITTTPFHQAIPSAAAWPTGAPVPTFPKALGSTVRCDEPAWNGSTTVPGSRFSPPYQGFWWFRGAIYPTGLNPSNGDWRGPDATFTFGTDTAWTNYPARPSGFRTGTQDANWGVNAATGAAFPLGFNTGGMYVSSNYGIASNWIPPMGQNGVAAPTSYEHSQNYTNIGGDLIVDFERHPVIAIFMQTCDAVTNGLGSPLDQHWPTPTPCMPQTGTFTVYPAGGSVAGGTAYPLTWTVTDTRTFSNTVTVTVIVGSFYSSQVVNINYVTRAMVAYIDMSAHIP